MYKIIKFFDWATQERKPVTLVRLADNAFIPFDDANTDFIEYKKWLAEGNEPEPADTQGEQ